MSQEFGYYSGFSQGTCRLASTVKLSQWEALSFQMPCTCTWFFASQSVGVCVLRFDSRLNEVIEPNFSSSSKLDSRLQSKNMLYYQVILMTSYSWFLEPSHCDQFMSVVLGDIYSFVRLRHRFSLSPIKHRVPRVQMSIIK